MRKCIFLSVALLVMFGVFSSEIARAAEGTPVLMIGDSMMRLLGIAMEKELKAADLQPATSFSSLGSGLARIDAFDWFAKIDALMKEHKPATVVVTLGANDRQTLKDTAGKTIPYGSSEWDVEYAERLGKVMDRLIQGSARKIIWLLLPDMREASQQAYAQNINKILEAEAKKDTRKDYLVLFDIRPCLTRTPGKFSQYMMAPNGAALTVRDADGVHLTTVGAQRVAQAIVKTYWK